MKVLLFVAALSLCACTTQKRTKANLAIDSEATPAAQQAAGEGEGASSDESAPEGEIDLGLEGGSGPVTVEATTTGEDEPEAKPAEAKADPKKKSTKKAAKPAEDEEEEPEEEGTSELVLE